MDPRSTKSKAIAATMLDRGRISVRFHFLGSAGRSLDVFREVTKIMPNSNHFSLIWDIFQNFTGSGQHKETRGTGPRVSVISNTDIGSGGTRANFSDISAFNQVCQSSFDCYFAYIRA